MLKYAWVIVALPAVSFFLIVFFGKRLPLKGAEIGIPAVGIGLVLSLVILWHFVSGQEPDAVARSFVLFTSGSFTVEVGTYIDGLAAMMLVVVTLVSLLVQIYSTSYMHGDRRYTWYYAALSLFTASMLNLVVAINLFQLLVGWELVGICSYLLIGHWWEEKENSNAAIKAFITTKTGDIPFLFGIFVLTVAAGTANIPEITHLAETHQIASGTLTVAALLLFGGAIGKSAQFPLHVWLPDAMAGPTPVSALIHAATMVAAGVYLVARMFAVFDSSGEALAFVGTIACITMLIAALLALIQDDIKKVLAYSTVSQLAYMMAGLSLGEAGYTAGLFQLFTHAFFKALLFLGAGSVIHAVHSNNMSEMGGLRKHMPVTFWTFVIGSAALAGIFPLAGFWSKDEIIAAAWGTGHYAIFAVALLTAVLTAFYMARAVLLTFTGEYRGTAHPHESPLAMTVPLMILASLAVVVGLLNATAFGLHLFTDWVHFGAVVESEAFNYGLAGISTVGALAGIAIGYLLYSRWKERDPLRRLGPVYTLLEHKYYLDDLYLRGIVRPIQYPIAAAVNWFDRRILNGAVDGAARAALESATWVNAFDQRVIDGSVNSVAFGTEWTGGMLRYLQSGNVQAYAVFLFAGVGILALAITLNTPWYLIVSVVAGALLAIIGVVYARARMLRANPRRAA